MTYRGLSRQIRETAERVAATEYGQACGFDAKHPSPELLREVSVELIDLKGLPPCRIRRVLERGEYGKQRIGQKSPGSGPPPRLSNTAKLARVLEALRAWPGKTYDEIAAELGMGAGNLRKWRAEIERAGLNRAQESQHGESENGADGGGATADSTPA